MRKEKKNADQNAGTKDSNIREYVASLIISSPLTGSVAPRMLPSGSIILHDNGGGGTQRKHMSSLER